MNDTTITGFIDAGSDADIGYLDVSGHVPQYTDAGFVRIIPQPLLPVRLWHRLSGFLRSARWHYHDHSLRFFLRCWWHWQRHPYWK